jgi:hypothetical protein
VETKVEKTPTAHLRFVERAGKRILQQQWEVTFRPGLIDYSGHQVFPLTKLEWYDVPYVTETKEKP